MFLVNDFVYLLNILLRNIFLVFVIVSFVWVNFLFVVKFLVRLFIGFIRLVSFDLVVRMDGLSIL